MLRGITVAAAVVGATSAMGGPSHCKPGESTVFSCSLGRKIVTLCASYDLSENSGHLRFRFGRPRAAEFVYPEANVLAREAFVGGTIDARGGDFVRFSRGGFTYTVETAFDPRRGEVAALKVHRGKKLVLDEACRSDALGDEGWSRVYRAKLPRELYHSVED